MTHRISNKIYIYIYIQTQTGYNVYIYIQMQVVYIQTQMGCKYIHIQTQIGYIYPNKKLKGNKLYIIWKTLFKNIVFIFWKFCTFIQGPLYPSITRSLHLTLPLPGFTSFFVVMNKSRSHVSTASIPAGVGHPLRLGQPTTRSPRSLTISSSAAIDCQQQTPLPARLELGWTWSWAGKSQLTWADLCSSHVIKTWLSWCKKMHQKEN